MVLFLDKSLQLFQLSQYLIKFEINILMQHQMMHRKKRIKPREAVSKRKVPTKANMAILPSHASCELAKCNLRLTEKFLIDKYYFSLTFNL